MKPVLLLLAMLTLLAPALPAEARIIGRSAEISIGREAASTVERYFRVDTDPVAVARVRQIGRRLAASVKDADFPFEFHVIEDKEVNAFALPGGFVYVFRGLLQLVPSDDALAFVLAHEISHVTRRHAISQFEKSLILSAGITAILAGTGARGYGDAATMVQELVGLAFTRHDESDADENGIEVLVRAGYDPRAAPEAMRVIRRAVGSDSGEPALLRSHPATESRIKRLTELGSELVARRAAERPRADTLPAIPPPAARRLAGLEDEAPSPCEWFPLVPGARWTYEPSKEDPSGGLEVRVLEQVEAEPRGVYRLEYTLARGVKSTRLIAPCGDRILSRGEGPAAGSEWRLEGFFPGGEAKPRTEGTLRFAGTERVRVRAGEFDAVRIERLGTDGKPEALTWYVHGVGLVRRLSPATGAVLELVSYSIPAAGAAPAAPSGSAPPARTPSPAGSGG